jgi:hypothetical protein
MEAVNIVMKLFRAMDESEQKATLLALGDEVEKTGLVEVPEKAKAATKGGSAKKKTRGWGGPGRVPYWVKTVDAIDTSKKGAEQIVGKFIGLDDLPEQIGATGYAVIGTRWPNRLYTVVRKAAGKNTRVYVGGSGNEDDQRAAVAGCVIARREASGFKKTLEALERRLADVFLLEARCFK